MIEPYKRPTFEVTGVEFKLKKSSPANTEKVIEYQQDLIERYSNIEDPSDISEDEEEESIRDMLELIAEPVGDEDFDDVDYRNADRKKVLYYLREGFLG
mgnify:CR=1 FL=1